ncbi:MAG TPA: type II secretion system protein N [Solimonas sp.]
MRMRTLYVLAGTLTFLVSLVLFAPAATVYGWLQPKLGDAVTLAGVEGSLREGHAAAVMVRGQPLTEKLHWKLSLSELLLARVGLDLETSGNTLMTGHVSKGFGVIRGSDLRIASSLKALMSVFGQPFAPIDGQANLELTRFKMIGDWPSDIEGSLRIQGLAWTLARDPVVLGDYQADIKPDGNDLLALVHTIGGSLDVNGDARAKPDHSYELHLQLRPKPNAAPLVVNLLRSLGNPDPQGYYHLRRDGKLP